MKTLLFILMAFICNSSFSQEINNFKIEDGAVIWQKIYESSLTKEQIVNQLKQNGFLKEMVFSDNTLTGEIKNIKVDYIGAGYRRMETPIALLTEDISAFVTIQFKENRFRVTLKQIKFTTTLETPLSKIGEQTPIETYALRKKNTVFKNVFLGDISKILNYTFNKIFEVKTKTENDNW